MGSTMAENHPVGFQWVIEAREKNNAKIIHVDPRFTRTSAMADLWVPLRAGTDIVFLGAMVRWALEHDHVFHDYIVHYTNAPVLLREDMVDAEDAQGVFSGYDPEKRAYDPQSWLYEGAARHSTVDTQRQGGHAKERGAEGADLGTFHRDPTLQHPRCVFQVLKRHFARYTPEMVERVCG